MTLRFLAATSASLLTICALPAFAQTTFPGNAVPSCQLTDDELNTWVTIGEDITGLPAFGPVYGEESGMVYVFPPNGPGFDKASDDYCGFYKWSAQMFGWITSDVNAKASASSHKPGPKTPLVLSSNFFFGVNDPGGNASFIAQNPITVHGVRTPKPVNADGTAQAGSSGVLLTQADNAVSNAHSLVYGGVSTNRMYSYMANRYQQSYTFEGKPVSFLKSRAETCDLMHYAWSNNFIDHSGPGSYFISHLCPEKEVAESADMAASAPLTISDLETAIDFLTMSMILKTTWVDARTLKHPEKYVLQMASVPVYDQTGDHEWPVQPKPDTIPLALVGMHIVGSVKGHPEMIWATIEHVNNAPSVPYHYQSTTPCAVASGDCVYSDFANQEEGNWLFSDGSTRDPNVMTAMVDGSGNIVSTTGHEIVATNAVRETPFGNPMDSFDGSPTSTSAATKNTMLISLNRQVMDWFKKMESNDPRQFYFLSGSVWTDGTQWPMSATDMSSTIGSSKLANTTAETFTQNQGCFSCHFNWAPKEGANIAATAKLSHVYGNFASTYPIIPVYGNAQTD